MCGILGTIGKKISKDTFSICLDRIQHRGPDGYGIWEDNGVILGHRRLSILDLSENGRQPMEYANGRYVITYNGEIYNFIELRDELKSLGYSFYTDTDTEVVLAAYAHWGEECQLRFNGMWSFAIWDKHNKSLFVSRDRYGIKPFFYGINSDGGFVFGSEMKAIMPLISQTSVNKHLLNSKYILQYEATDECLISEIKRLPAGCCGTYTDGRLSIHKWWRTIDHLPSVSNVYEEQVEQFRELFLDACKLRMRSDVTIGTALSGGLDSSATICAMAYIARLGGLSRENSDWQHAFIGSLQGTSLDETEYAKCVTQYLGIGHTIIDLSAKPNGDDLEKYIYQCEDIHTTSPVPMMLTYAGIRNGGAIVSIDGHGADELFGGYAMDFVHAYPDANGNRMAIDDITDAYYEAFPHDGGNRSVTKSDIEKMYEQYMKSFKVRRLPRFMLHKMIPSEYDINKDVKLDYFDQILYERTHKNILPTLLRNYDRYSMANSVEIRMPFMDYRIVDFAFAIPWSSKIRNGYSKAIVRDALRDFMPSEVVNRRTKIGFNTPIVEWMQGPLKEYFEDMVDSTEFSNSDIVRAKMVRKLVYDVTRDKKATYTQGELAWMSVQPFIWERAFYKKAML